LQIIDKTNFDADVVEDCYSQAVDFIFKLHAVKEEEGDVEKAHNTNEVKTDELPKMSIPKKAAGYGAVISEQRRALQAMVKEQIRNMSGVSKIATERSLEKKKDALKEKIIMEMNDYRMKCEALSVIQLLEIYGNDTYKLDKSNQIVDYEQIIDDKEVEYINKYFDLLGWWRVHSKHYPFLSLGASIVLGKPTHNAYQERVFSMGTYKDSKLRKRLKEDSFELSVLNAVNAKQTKEMKDVFAEIKREVGVANDKKIAEEDLKTMEVANYLEKRATELEVVGEVGVDVNNTDNEVDVSCFDFLVDESVNSEDDDDVSLSEIVAYSMGTILRDDEVDVADADDHELDIDDDDDRKMPAVENRDESKYL
jgi:hypothetical protein